jgi:hypothetical protein
MTIRPLNFSLTAWLPAILLFMAPGFATACPIGIGGTANPNATVCAQDANGTTWCSTADGSGNLNLIGAAGPPSTGTGCLPGSGTFFVFDIACPNCGKNQNHFVGNGQNLPVDVRCGCNSGKGMTWRLNSTNAITGTIDVGCGYSNNANECNPHTGDTMCSMQLPVLCFKPTQLPVPANVDNSNQYHKWSGGIVATTPAVAGNSASNPDLTTIANADSYCAQQFGPGWRVAEFHDGWGWYFQAYGGIGQPSQRFWVDINDQRSTVSTPKATCWH